MKRTRVRLSEVDEKVIGELLEAMLRPVIDVLTGYQKAAHIVPAAREGEDY